MFRNEEEREIGFRSILRTTSTRAVVELTDTDGLDDDAVRERAVDRLHEHPEVVAVYSIGGGNRAILDAFADVGRVCRVFIGHDVDRDNRALLARQRISAVLYHDLASDVRRACQLIMQFHGAIEEAATAAPSPVQVITPFNIPSPIH